LVGPLYLKGQRQRYYILVCKDVFDSAVCLKLSRSRKMDATLAFLGDCWKTLGRPAQVQFDNARELVGWEPAARYLSRIIRLCLRFGVEPIFIPPRRPQYQGSVENFNGWFQPQLLQRRYTQPNQLKRELQRLQETVNTQHVHRRLGGSRQLNIGGGATSNCCQPTSRPRPSYCRSLLDASRLFGW
jgi:putative transposase